MKALKWIVIIVLIIIVAIVLLIGPILNWGVKAGVETVGPKATQTEVKLASANISPWSGMGTLKGLVVGNPEGFEQPSSFELGSIYVAIERQTITQDEIVINEIAIDGANLTFEKTLKTSNLSTIQNNVNDYAEKFIPQKPTESEPEATAKKEPPPEESKGGIIIKKFVFTNGKVKLSGFGIEKELPIEEIILPDIGERSKPVTIADAIMQIMAGINKKVAEAVMKEGLPVADLLDSVKAADLLKNLKLDAILEKLNAEELMEKVDTEKVLEALPEKAAEEGKKLLDKLPFGN